MSRRKARVLEFIRSNPDLDDDQIAERLNIHPRQAINQIANGLATQRLITRTKSARGKLVNRATAPKLPSGRKAPQRVKRAALRAMIRRWIRDKVMTDRWALKHGATTLVHRPNWKTAGVQRRYRSFVFYDEAREVELRILDTDGDGFGFSFHALGSPSANFSLGLKGPGSEYAPASHATVIGGQTVLHFPPRSARHDLAFDIPVSDDLATLDALLKAGLALMRDSDTRSEAEKAEIKAAEPRTLLYTLREVRTRQAAFRAKLMEAYGFRCALSGCDVQEILTAAHIVPYETCKGTALEEEEPNGILLRVDLHGLFDAGYFDLVPKDGRIVVQVLRTAKGLGVKQGQALTLPQDPAHHPSPAYLRERRALQRDG